MARLCVAAPQGDFGDRYFGTVEVAEKSEEFSTTNATLHEQK